MKIMKKVKVGTSGVVDDDAVGGWGSMVFVSGSKGWSGRRLMVGDGYGGDLFVLCQI